MYQLCRQIRHILIVRLRKFFRKTLLTKNTEEILGLVKSYENQVKQIKDELLRFCWYMRGGISYSDAMLLSTEDRKIINNIIKDNLETAKKSGMPFF